MSENTPKRVGTLCEVILPCWKGVRGVLLLTMRRYARVGEEFSSFPRSIGMYTTETPIILDTHLSDLRALLIALRNPQFTKKIVRLWVLFQFGVSLLKVSLKSYRILCNFSFLEKYAYK